MGKVDWKWLIIGMVIALFVLPFVQAKLGGAFGSRRNLSANN